MMADSQAQVFDVNLTGGVVTIADFTPSRGDQLNQAYRLYGLALAKAPDLSAMNRLKEQTNLQLQARWRLAAAYHLAGQ